MFADKHSIMSKAGVSFTAVCDLGSSPTGASEAPGLDGDLLNGLGSGERLPRNLIETLLQLEEFTAWASILLQPGRGEDTLQPCSSGNIQLASRADVRASTRAR